MTSQPTTLGEKLAPPPPPTRRRKAGRFLTAAVLTALNITFLVIMAALLIWWIAGRLDVEWLVLLGLLVVPFALWMLVLHQQRALKREAKIPPGGIHSLLAHDRQGFMADLRLDEKTVLLDGSNIYHFGHNQDLDALPLGAIANQLRYEGYRVVCFFDANIFYTLSDHGAFDKDEPHSNRLLQDIFGLEADEIYVVPGGVQADKYILNSLKHLPLSFIVSNDRYRDHAKHFRAVMKGDQWRKSIKISKNEVKLRKFRFQEPVLLD